MKRPTCYLICGFLGAGKTTYAKKLAKEAEAVHLNPDDWCMKLFDQIEYEKNWNECFDKAIEYLWKKASEYAQEGISVVFDMGFWTKKSRDDARQRAVRLGFSPVLYYIYAPDDILKKRIATRPGAIAEHNFEHFDELKKRFEEPEITEQYVKIENY